MDSYLSATSVSHVKHSFQSDHDRMMIKKSSNSIAFKLYFHSGRSASCWKWYNVTRPACYKPICINAEVQLLK